MALLPEEIMIMDQKSTALKNGVLCITSTGSQLIVLKNSALDKRLERLRQTLSYQSEYVKETFSDELWQAMEHRNLSQADFARKAGVSKQYLTKVFRGGNCTIETMVRLAYGLNYKLHVHLTPNELGCDWIHAIPQSAPRPPERFTNLWTESGYQSIANVKKEVTV